MNIVNAALADGNSSCMFVTLFLASLDLSTLAIGLRARRPCAAVPAERHRAWSNGWTHAGGPPLGLVENHAYKQHSVELSPDESLLVVTDGFTEANDPDGQLYGDARIAEFLPASRPAIRNIIRAGAHRPRLRSGAGQALTTWRPCCCRSADRRAMRRFEAHVRARRRRFPNSPNVSANFSRTLASTCAPPITSR